MEQAGTSFRTEKMTSRRVSDIVHSSRKMFGGACILKRLVMVYDTLVHSVSFCALLQGLLKQLVAFENSRYLK